MDDRGHFSFPRGEPVPRAELLSTQELAQRTLRGSFDGIDGYLGTGGSVLAEAPPSFLAKITSQQSAGANAYGFTEVLHAPSGFVVPGNPVTSDSSTAREIGGNTAVPTDGSAIVRMWPSHTPTAGWDFEYRVTGGGGPPPALAHGHALLSADTAISSFSPTTLLTVTVPVTGVYLFLATVPIVCPLAAAKWAVRMTEPGSNLLAYVAGANAVTTGTLAPQYHATLQQISNGPLSAGTVVTLAANLLDGAAVTAAGSGYGGALGGTCLNYLQVA